VSGEPKPVRKGWLRRPRLASVLLILVVAFGLVVATLILSNLAFTDRRLREAFVRLELECAQTSHCKNIQIRGEALPEGSGTSTGIDEIAAGARDNLTLQIIWRHPGDSSTGTDCTNSRITVSWDAGKVSNDVVLCNGTTVPIKIALT